MLSIILTALMLIFLSLGVFFFSTVLFLPCLFATLLLGLSLMYFFQDIVFKVNSVLLGIADLLLKLSYFALVFAICFIPQKSILSYALYGAVVVVGLFDIFALRFKRKDIFLERENKEIAYGFMKHSVSPKKLKNQSGISDNLEKLECHKGYYYTKLAFIFNIIAMILCIFAVIICRPRSIQILNLVCIAVIFVVSVISAVFQFMSIKAVKAPVGYKITVLVMGFFAPILYFCSEIYLTEIFVGAILWMLGIMFFAIVLYVSALSSLYYNKRLDEIKKEE